MLLYGTSGTGKTTVAATFPDPLLWMLCSGGNRPGELKSVDTPANRQRITPRNVVSFDQFGSLISDADAFATVVLDHASGLADLILSHIIGKPVPAQKGWGLATQQQYAQLGLQCKEAFRALLNLPCNVVILAQERVFGGKDDGMDSDVIKPTVGAALTPSVTGWLNPACDYVVQAFKRNKTQVVNMTVNGQTRQTTKKVKGVEYCLRVGPDETYMTKFRCPGGVKHDVIVVGPDDGYERIMAAIRGEGPGQEGTTP